MEQNIAEEKAAEAARENGAQGNVVPPENGSAAEITAQENGAGEGGTGGKKKFWHKAWNYVKAIVPGVALCAVIAVPAWFLGKLVPVIGSAVFAIVIGMIIAFFRRPKWLEGGIRFTSKKVLQGSIVFLGFGMNFITVLEVGGNSVLIILSTIATSLIVSFAMSRLLKVPAGTATLVGVGSSICGGSAIAATAPVIRAKDSEVATSISVIFLFNVIAAFTFPAIGQALGMSDTGFGMWAGTAINDTSSVVAAGQSWERYGAELCDDRQTYANAGDHPDHACAGGVAADPGAPCGKGRGRRSGCFFLQLCQSVPVVRDLFPPCGGSEYLAVPRGRGRVKRFGRIVGCRQVYDNARYGGDRAEHERYQTGSQRLEAHSAGIYLLGGDRLRKHRRAACSRYVVNSLAVGKASLHIEKRAQL